MNQSVGRLGAAALPSLGLAALLLGGTPAWAQAGKGGSVGQIYTCKAERERQAAIERQRAQNIIRRDQALVTRYPDQAAHDAARAEALAQSQVVVDAAERRLAELATERKALDDEMEFYKKDPSKAPAKVRRAIEDNAQSVALQQRAIAGQQEERQRINARFDEEAARLQQLWRAKAEHAAGAGAGR